MNVRFWPKAGTWLRSRPRACAACRGTYLPALSLTKKHDENQFFKRSLPNGAAENREMFAMKRRVLVACAILPALVAADVMTRANLAVAQQAGEDMDEIVVKAPVERPRFLRGGMQEPLEQIELQRRVSYADLDLSKDANVTELRTRIETTANDSCKKLSKMFPRPSDAGEISRCTNRAVDGAEEQVQAAIAAAR